MVYWEPDHYYFLTSSTFLHYPLFNSFDAKKIVLDRILQVENSLMSCFGYSVAVNHQHSIFKPQTSEDFSKAKKIINGGSAYDYNKKFPLKIKNKNYFWGDVKTLKILGEETYWKIIGYVSGNLLKHREVKSFKELYNSPFSSFRKVVDEYGMRFAQDLVLNVINLPDVESNLNSFIKELTIEVENEESISPH